MSKYELTYFDIRCQAEPIRIMLTYVGADWEDIRIPDQTPIPDDILAKCPFGELPLLEVDGQKLTEFMAIMRYIGRRHNLAGKDDMESAKVDEIAVGAHNLFFVTMKAHLKDLKCDEEDQPPDEMVEAIQTVKSRFIAVFEKLAEQNGGFLVGNSRTWADILVAYIVDNTEYMTGIELTDESPALKQLISDILNHKAVKEYIANRPDTYF